MTARSTSRSTFGWLTGVALIALGTFGAAGAEAQQARLCGPRADLVKQLSGDYQERTMAVGIADNGNAVLEILASPNGSTWTLLYSMASGISCMVYTGQDWQQFPAVAALGPEA